MSNFGHHVDIQNITKFDITKKVRVWMSIGHTLLIRYQYSEKNPPLDVLWTYNIGPRTFGHLLDQKRMSRGRRVLLGLTGLYY